MEQPLEVNTQMVANNILASHKWYTYYFLVISTRKELRKDYKGKQNTEVQ